MFPSPNETLEERRERLFIGILKSTLQTTNKKRKSFEELIVSLRDLLEIKQQEPEHQTIIRGMDNSVCLRQREREREKKQPSHVLLSSRLLTFVLFFLSVSFFNQTPFVSLSLFFFRKDGIFFVFFSNLSHFFVLQGGY